MFQRWIQLLRARRALAAGRYRAALALLEDPLVAGGRRALELRAEVLAAWLERARRRLAAGEPELAARDLEGLASVEPELEGLAELQAEVDRRLAEAGRRAARREECLRAFEEALHEGRLHGAREVLRRAGELFDDGERRDLEARLEARRKEASRALAAARSALDRGASSRARQAFERARKLCSDSLAFEDRLRAVGGAFAKERWEAVQAAMRAGRPVEAAQALAAWWEAEERPEDFAEAYDLRAAVCHRLAAEAGALAAGGAFDEAHRYLLSLPRLFTGLPALARLARAVEDARFWVGAVTEDPRRRARALKRLRDATGWEALAASLGEAETAARELEQGLAAARASLAEGRSEEAKTALERLALRYPACSEIELLLTGLRQDEAARRARLERAREAVRAGRLAEAARELAGLAGPGPCAAEARHLLADVEGVIARVRRDLAALEAALEAGGDLDALHERLQDLEKRWTDGPEVQALRERLDGARRRRRRVSEVEAALEGGKPGEAAAALRSWLEEGGAAGFQREDREALQRLGARLGGELEGHLRAGRAALVHDLAASLEGYAEVLGLELGGLAGRAAARLETAEARAARGIELLEHRDREGARRALDEAAAEAADAPLVLRLRHRLAAVERDRERLEQAVKLAAEDPEAARALVRGVGPTPAPLRTLAFRARTELERAGDFETGCRLEVEEGGEFLVLFGSRLTIGNATAALKPDLPVLARIKGRHAVFERRASFHGGVRDHIEAADGARLEVNGRALRAAALEHGDRLLLGGVLPIRYRRPHPHSVAAVLRLERGFECEGATRILWLRQGGRDGGVRLGKGPKVHVALPGRAGEVLLYAPGPGRLRVACSHGGEVDGKRFQKEAELSPGAEVQCAGIAFRVLPRRS